VPVHACMLTCMPAVALLAFKGGVGKTTLALHLAVAAGDALLVDVDRQRSASGWWRTREAELPELVAGEAAGVGTAIAATKRAWVIVDTAPAIDADARAVATTADLCLIPTRPAILDLRAIAGTVELVQNAGKPGVIVLNACPPGRGTAEAGIVTEARRALRAYGLPIAPVAVTQRAALSHALASGKAVTEFEPDGRAADEIKRLWRWVSGQAGRAEH
jgi:chromosome partitioning protein